MQMEDFTGREFGEFIVRGKIGAGGMAAVYRAHQPAVNRDVAIKIIKVGMALDDSEFRRRFAQEAEVIAALEHIHILPIYSYGIDNDIAYLAMRLLRGGSLDTLLRDGPLPFDQTAMLFEQFARGLAHAHNKGIIHRDIKPGNVLLDEVGNAYLTDFGLAKMVGGESNLTKTGSIVGTPAYMSPEQLRGDPINHLSDVYSMGVLLYHMVSGKPPFGADSSGVVSIIYSHLEKAPSPPSELNPDVPGELEMVVLQAMHKDPDKRFGSVGEMAEAVKAAVGMTVGSSSYPVVNPDLAGVELKKEVPKRNYRMVWGAAAAVVVVIALVLLLVLSNTANNDTESQASTESAQTAVAVQGTQTSVANFTPTPLPLPEVIAGAVGGAADAIPSADEIAIAQQRVGEGGFIAYLASTLDSEYHATQSREMADFAAEYGLDFRAYDAETDEYQQLTQFEEARREGAAGLIVFPLGVELLSEALESAQEAGIPMVFVVDLENTYGGVVLNSDSDNYVMGLRAGHYAGELIRDEMDGQADVIILDYPDVEIIVERANGLEQGVLDFAPGAEVVGRYLGGTREFAYDSVHNLLEEGVNFDVIVSINDAGSFGAIQALEEAGVAPDAVIISSIDSEILAMQYIREDYYLRGSLSVGRRETAQNAINSLTRLLGGGTMPGTIFQEVGDMVTKETLAEIEAEATEEASD